MSDHVSPQAPSIQVATQVIDALLASGVTRFVYAPGSRNAPFAYVLSEYEDVQRLTVNPFAEERGAGFFALGSSLVEPIPSPVAVFTTSGTAVSELHPAVLEAYHRGVPLIVVSADRPFEVQNTAASQTTNQAGMFGDHVVSQVALPALGKAVSQSQLLGVFTQVVRLVERAKGWSGQPGPVHLNVAFAEPLVPNIPPALTKADAGQPAPKFQAPKFVSQRPTPIPFERVVDPELATVIVAGDGANRTLAFGGCEVGEARALVDAVAELGVPLISEPTANLAASSNWVPHGPWILEALGDQVEQVVVVGHPTLTRPVSRLLAKPEVRKVVVSAAAQWPDPAGNADVVVPCLAPPSTEGENATALRAKALLPSWRKAAERVDEVLNNLSELNHLTAAQAIWQSSTETDLWLGASNPIRAFDLAARGVGSGGVFSNRGLAGIDGVVALGLGAQQSRGNPLRVVLGDLTFAYDLPSLGARPAEDQDVQLIVFSDGGGTIFSSLEHGRAATTQMYDRFFAVKQNVDVVAVGAACGWTASVVTTLADLEDQLRKPVRGRSLVEVRMENPANLFDAVREQAIAVAIDPGA